jgi:ABC-type uncharacterized transport system substrate-binding protein
MGAGMRRREFNTLVGGAVVWPLTARAQPNKKTPRVGVLWHAGSAEEEAIYLASFQQGLKGLNYIDGQTIALEHRFPNEQPERFVSLAAELAALRVDVLVAVTQSAALAAQQATTTIPIVFILVLNPVQTKLVNSLARPGGNITGLTQFAAELNVKRLELFKEAFPDMIRVALLVNPKDPVGTQNYINETTTAATNLGIDVLPVEAPSLGDLEATFNKIAEGRFEGVMVAPNGLFYQGRTSIAQLALARQLPLMQFSRETLEAGALMSYGTDFRAIFRRAAVYVDNILKGENPADMPVEQPTRFEFLINFKTAKALGFIVPPQLLTRADEVIE